MITALGWPWPADARDRWYAGAITRQPPNDASLALVDEAWAIVARTTGDPLRAHARPLPEFLDRLRAARQALWSERLRDRVHDVLRAAGQEPEDWAIDRLRLRAVPPGGPTTPEARAAWAVHRDTWYANPGAQVNLWLPLVDVTAATSLQLYPASFARPVANDSGAFDYDRFLAEAGWQADRPGRAPYPEALIAPDEPPVGVSAPRGALVAFAAQHLHGSPVHHADHTRWSVDVRIVHRADHAAGRGAARVDARCTGDASRDYRW